MCKPFNYTTNKQTAQNFSSVRQNFKMEAADRKMTMKARATTYLGLMDNYLIFTYLFNNTQ